MSHLLTNQTNIFDKVLFLYIPWMTLATFVPFQVLSLFLHIQHVIISGFLCCLLPVLIIHIIINWWFCNSFELSLYIFIFLTSTNTDTLVLYVRLTEYIFLAWYQAYLPSQSYPQLPVIHFDTLVTNTFPPAQCCWHLLLHYICGLKILCHLLPIILLFPSCHILLLFTQGIGIHYLSASIWTSQICLLVHVATQLLLCRKFNMCPSFFHSSRPLCTQTVAFVFSSTNLLSCF